jgi:hypothetical protein
MTNAEIIDQIRRHHRRRRFAMKIQQKLDRALESFLRINATDWAPDLDDKAREKINAQIKAMIKKIRDGDDDDNDFGDIVRVSDEARAPADAMRKASEDKMAELAMTLPVYPWIESVRGAGALGLATIVAEAGNLANYSNVAKVWKRLGFAPFEGFAGSTWKRETWRPRKLTAEEWIANPFSGERYALMSQIATWLVNAQWIGKAKSASGEGEPNGIYGTAYDLRRKHTLKMHPDWTDGHRRNDALRIAMKEFLKDLFLQWNNVVVENKARRQRRWKQVSRIQRDINMRRREDARAAE